MIRQTTIAAPAPAARRTRLITLAVLAAATTAVLTACGTSYPLAPPASPPVAPVASTATDAGTAAGAAASEPGAPGAGATGSGPVRQPGGSGGSGHGSTSGGTSGGHTGGGQGTPAPPAAPAAAIAGFRVVTQPVCAVHGTPDAPFSTPGSGVTIAWSVTGADGAALAVDNPTTYGAYGTSYPATGQQEFPFTCEPGTTTSHTFTVWPAGAKGTSKTLTVSAHSDG